MKPTLTSEFNPLKKVLLHTPGPEHKQLIPWDGDHVLMGSDPRAYQELQQDHAYLKNFISKEIGSENVLELKTLLEEIFEKENYHYRYKVLQDTLHTMADTYIDHLQSRGIHLQSYQPAEIVKDLILGYPRSLTLNNGRLPNILIPPQREIMWMRDPAAVTPAGVMISSMARPRRQMEPQLLRTVFKYHPMFDPDTIFLDMVEFFREMNDDPTWSGISNKYLIEGGDVMVLSEDTLAIGVGKDEYIYSDRTSRQGFLLFVEKLLAADKKKKIKRIYQVNVPDLKGFIHLDTVFTMLGPKSAIAMPYIFGQPKPSGLSDAKLVLQQFVNWLRKNMGAKRTDLSRIPSAEDFENTGKVEVYDRAYIEKRGKIERTPEHSRYFLDQLVHDGILDSDKIVWIGGNPDDYHSPYEHLMTALFDQHNMAGNIFATQPFHVVAYARNPVTNHILQNHLYNMDPNAHVEFMSSNELRTDDGGPRCLVMPLEREP